jgi:RNA recognition motif-containing protein
MRSSAACDPILFPSQMQELQLRMNIRVTNLSLNIIEKDLNKLFSAYGEVGYLIIIRDKRNGRSKGNAFLEMPNQFQAEQAIMALNHMEVDGLRISVEEIEYRAGEFNN